MYDETSNTDRHYVQGYIVLAILFRFTKAANL